MCAGSEQNAERDECRVGEGSRAEMKKEKAAQQRRHSLVRLDEASFGEK